MQSLVFSTNKWESQDVPGGGRGGVLGNVSFLEFATSPNQKVLGRDARVGGR